MTEEQKQRNIKLAEALESGEYKQGKQYLHSNDSFCCLGVACDLFNKATGEQGWESLGRQVLDFCINGEITSTTEAFAFGEDHDDDSELLPPPDVQRWYGWDSNNPVLNVTHGVEAASELNDNGISFTDIAKGFRSLAQ